MEYVKDITWKKGKTAHDLLKEFKTNGFQSIQLYKAGKIIKKMILEDSKVYLTFTSNMVTSGLRGLFSEWIKYGLVDGIITTTGGIEEDIMRAQGEKFLISSFNADDINLHEKGENRVGNLLIKNDSYVNFEAKIIKILEKIAKKTPRISVNNLLKEIGKNLDDEKSILYQAAKKNIPIYSPGITDGSLGFHLYMTQNKYPDFVVDVIKDFSDIITKTTHDDKKGIIALGGGISKHHAILASVINGGADYAVYMTTSRSSSGSMSGATTDEAKSWGKIKDDSDSVTVNGDVSILFPLVTQYVFDELDEMNLLR